MSHQLGLDSVIEKLVFLEHFAFGSERYCCDRLIGSEQDQGNGAYDEYWGRVKGVVSAYLIECAVRTRMLQDTLRGDDAKKLAELDLRARSGLTVGTILDGTFDLTLRETCNKIIHARMVVPQWAVGRADDVECKYWSGDYRLAGTRGQDTWDLILHVAPWARAMSTYLAEADSAELTFYVGQDWY